MIFNETELKGVFKILIEKDQDERGFFAVIWNEKKFEEKNLKKFIDISVSFNIKKGTLRGMHFQTPPFQEAKLVSCLKGKIFDVILDLRPSSPTFKKWISVELDSDINNSVYIPEGCAHGFQTLENESLVYYQISKEYSLQHTSGIRWNDLAIKIDWPLDVSEISKRDENLKFFDELTFNFKYDE